MPSEAERILKISQKLTKEQGVWTLKVIFQSGLADRNMPVESNLKVSLKR